ncbi:hypothetical protein BHE74_00013131 [Ensete ventricosum]|nr:hypothetical protein BHE74_00013131 [Ensete ventricosum]RZS29082.1 hypothetical protein BHM03_00062762 [Ensete ventricosum]
MILLLSVGQSSVEHSQHRRSFRSNRPALFLQCYRPPSFEALTIAPLPCCSLPVGCFSRHRCVLPYRCCPCCRSRFNRAPCRCISLLPSLHLLTAAAPCSSLGCRNNRCPSQLPPPLATTTAPPSPSSFSIYW